MKRFLAIILATLLVSMTLASCGEASVEDEVYIPIRTTNTINYETSHATVGSIIEQVTLTGVVTTPYTMDLSFTYMSGSIAQLNVRQDQEVKKGDVIAVLNGDALEDEIAVQQLNLDSARTLYETLQSQHASEEDIEFARIDFEIEELKYNNLVDKRNHLTLVAPFDGRITSVYARTGSYAEQNSPVCTISDSSKVALTVSDYNSQLSDVSFGTRVDVNQGALASTSGRVVDTVTVSGGFGGFNFNNFGGGGQGNFGGGFDWNAEITCYVIQCDEEIEFSDLGGIQVTFTTFRRDDAVIVPSNAVFEATDAANVTSNYVNVLMNGIKVQTPVVVGVTSGDKTEILSGLDGSETLIMR